MQDMTGCVWEALTKRSGLTKLALPLENTSGYIIDEGLKQRDRGQGDQSAKDLVTEGGKWWKQVKRHKRKSLEGNLKWKGN